jgi:Rhodanese-related sulfurtransferase
MTLADELSIESKMGEIMETLPGAKRALFAKYHLGGCSSCAFSDTETLGELSKRSEIAADEVLEHLLASHAHDEQMFMSATDAKSRMDGGEAIHLLDIRTREEHEAVAIPGSGFFTQESQQKFFSMDPATMILIYDHQGKSVLDQVAWFRGHAMKNTFGLKGGIDAWSREVDPSIQRYRLEMD